MATRYLKLMDGVSTGDVLTAEAWNKMVCAQDRGGGLILGELLGRGVLEGWEISIGSSTVGSGAGLVGACWCQTTAPQAISNLASGMNYVFARTNVGSPGDGTVDFVSRPTSAPLSNDDGITSAIRLGKGTYTEGSGLTSVDTSARQEWEIDHGALAGLSDDDHPQYMQPVEAGLQVLSAFAPAQSGAAVSTCGTVLPQPVAKYPAGSTTQAGWTLTCPAQHSGAVTVYTDWLSAGESGVVCLELLGRCASPGDEVDAALSPLSPAQTVSIDGAQGELWRTSFAWTSNKPAAGEHCTVVIRRDGASASDTMSGAARLLGGTVRFETALW